jgi:hypothetical protein
MSVMIKNDGKGKCESYTATLNIPHNNALSGHFAGEMVGYGATATEARENLIDAAKGLNLAVATAASENLLPARETSQG